MMSISTAQEILHLILEKWATSKINGDCASFSTMISKGLILTGLPSKGTDVLEMHSMLLKYLLDLKDDEQGCNFLSQSTISWGDYFELLSDETLRWHEILSQTLPYMNVTMSERFMEALVRHSGTSLSESLEVTPGVLHLYAAGVTQGLSIMLDLLLHCDNSENEHFGYEERTILHSVVSHTKMCLDVLCNLLETQSGRLCLLESKETFHSIIVPLLMAVYLACPAIDVDNTEKVIAQNHIQNQKAPTSGESLLSNDVRKDRTRRNITVRQKKREVYFANLTTPVTELTLAKVNVTEDSIDIEACVKSSCQEIVSEFKSACQPDVYKKIVFSFCRGTYKDNSKFYKPLKDIVFTLELFFINNHQFHSNFFSEEVFPLLFYLVKSEDEPSDSNAVSTVFSTAVGCINGSKVPNCLRSEGKIFPDELICSLSIVQKVLASGQKLEGDADFEFLYRVVQAKKCGWRDLMSLGLQNEDFMGWWKNGFYKLFWDLEASLSTEQNVLLIMKALGLSVKKAESGECEKEMVQNIMKLLSIMFLRLPTLVQERVVLLYYINVLPGSNSQTASSKALRQSPCQTLLYPFHTNNDVFSGSHIDSMKSPLDDLSLHNISTLMEEERVAGQLILTLNKLTESNANEMTPSLLYLCVFQPLVVIDHLVQAAITSQGQTNSVLKVFGNMPTVCRLANPLNGSPILVDSLFKQILSSGLEEKEARNVIFLLSELIEPYKIQLNDGKLIVQQEMKGVMSLKEVLHTFIFPSLSSASLDSLPSDAKTNTEALVESYDQTILRIPSEDAQQGIVSEQRLKNKATQDSSSFITLDQESPSNKKLPLNLALTVLERLLEKASASQASLNFIEFDPLPLLVVLCDCYASNYTVLVTVDTDNHGVAGLHLSRIRRTLRLVTEKCLSLVLGLTVLNLGLFSEMEKCWLYQEVTEKSWLHLSMLAPILTCSSNWEQQYISAFDSLCEVIKSLPNKNTQKMVHLIQMALTNTKMLSLISPRLPSLLASLSSANFLVALKWILLTSMPSEMERLVLVIKHLPVKSSHVLGDSVRKNVKPLYDDEDTGTEIWQLDVCHKLTDALLLLDASTESEVLRCHAITNYQAAIQCIVNSDNSAHSSVTLSTIFSQVCIALASQGGKESSPGNQAIQILQVTAMDVLTKLKVAMKKTDDKGDIFNLGVKKSAGVKVANNRKGGRKQAVDIKLLKEVSDCIECITFATVREILNKQIEEFIS